LEVKAAKDALRRPGVIVLNPLSWQAKVTEIVLAVGLHEKATLIA
jgi:hypothetical protein